MPEQYHPSRIVGILGGMGPSATVDFYAKLIRAADAPRDQDHLRVVIWADPTVPDRHKALLEDGEDPTPWLENGVQHLIECGAEILVVPCNTIHAYMPAVIDRCNIEFISIIDTAIEAAFKAAMPAAGCMVGLLSTDGALKSGLYQTALRRAGMEPMLPSATSQETLMQVIYSVKAGTNGQAEQEAVRTLLDELQSAGASTVIAGCTEVSTLLAQLETDIPIIDPSQAMALETIKRARTIKE